MTRRSVNTVVAAAVLFLVLVPLGTSVFILGFVAGDSPCILCWAQRIGMAIVALIGLFVLRYGPKPKYVGLAILVSAYGAFMAIRHSSLHLARDIGQGFAIDMLGAHTYVWSFAVFMVCIVVMAGLLMSVPAEDLRGDSAARPLGALGNAAAIAFLVVTAGTIAQAFASTGPPPYVGQSDPVRFSFNPKHWVWSMGEFESAPIALRGRWAVEHPDVTAVDANPATSPLPHVPQLKVIEQRKLDLALHGPVTDLAYDKDTDRFLLTTTDGVYLTDGALRRIVRYTVVDPLFSVDLGRFAGAAFLDSHTIIAVSENKSYVTLKESDAANGETNYRRFIESPTAFDELARSRLATVRARLMYVLSAAVDPATHSVYTITVPNAQTKRWVVSRFDGGDLQLAEEFLPKIDPALAGTGSNPLDAFYICAATIADGGLYALSAAHSTLLTIDRASHTVAAAQTIPGLAQPVGLAKKEGRWYIAAADGTLTVAQ
jgi:disulfide bond formation protein DsbB